MYQAQLGVRALSAFGAAVLFAACSGSGSSSSGVLPSGVAASAPGGLERSPESAAKKGSGPWGLSLIDTVYVEGGSNPYTCSGPPSGVCNAYVEKRVLKDSLTTSDAYGSASLKSTTTLGTLTGSSRAASSGKGEQSSTTSVNIGWEDTFTVTSKTLPPGTPVSFTATLEVVGKPFHCSTFGSGELSISSQSGLSFEDFCASTPPPVLTVAINAAVGGHFTDGVGLTFDTTAGGVDHGGQFGSELPKITYHLAVTTHGASYVTASGAKYP